MCGLFNDIDDILIEHLIANFHLTLVCNHLQNVKNGFRGHER